MKIITQSSSPCTDDEESAANLLLASIITNDETTYNRMMQSPLIEAMFKRGALRVSGDYQN